MILQLLRCDERAPTLVLTDRIHDILVFAIDACQDVLQPGTPTEQVSDEIMRVEIALHKATSRSEMAYPSNLRNGAASEWVQILCDFRIGPSLQ